MTVAKMVPAVVAPGTAWDESASVKTEAIKVGKSSKRCSLFGRPTYARNQATACLTSNKTPSSHVPNRVDHD